MKSIKRTATGMLIPMFCLLFCGCYSYWKALFGVLIIASPFISHDMQSEDEGYNCIQTSGCWPVAAEETCGTDESVFLIDPEPEYSVTDEPSYTGEPACSTDSCPSDTDTETPAAQTDSGRDSNERREWNRR